jgi:hypothetical protein
MYYLYHIKGVKWGCTKNLKQRLSRQGYSISDCFEIITVDNIDVASTKEKELNIEYGYNWQDTQNYKYVTKKWCTSDACKKGAQNSAKSTSIPILAYEYTSNKFINEYKSIREASRELNMLHPNILLILKGKIKQCNGYTFQYKFVK